MNNVSKILHDLMKVKTCETRFNMHGVNLEQSSVENTVIAVVTSGYVLHKKVFYCENTFKMLENFEDKSVLIQKSKENITVLKFFMKNIGENIWSYNEGDKTLQLNAMLIRFADCDYVKYESVIPSRYDDMKRCTDMQMIDNEKDKSEKVFEFSLNFDLLKELVDSFGDKKLNKRITFIVKNEISPIIIENHCTDNEISINELMDRIIIMPVKNN